MHEAGHAVVSWRLGRSFEEITVIPGEDYLGRVVSERIAGFRPDVINDSETQRIIDDHVMISLAGVEA
ncbi:MAG: hypothetical protein ACXV2I_03540, partial [Actinomycetes bacterium]